MGKAGPGVVAAPHGCKENSKVKKKKAQAMSEAEKKIALEYFKAYDYSGDGCIDYTELSELLNDLNLPVDQATLKLHIQEWGGLPELAAASPTSKGVTKGKVTKMFKGFADGAEDLAYLKITFEEFCKIWSQIMSAQTAGVRQSNAGDRVTVAALFEGEDNLREAFQAYDVDGSGALDAEEIAALFEDLGLPDYDGDGYAQMVELAQMETGMRGPITYQQFVRYRNMIVQGISDVQEEAVAAKAAALVAEKVAKEHKPLLGQRTKNTYSALIASAS
jgi:Ca2+-binding EF-hand superfamily protein